MAGATIRAPRASPIVTTENVASPGLAPRAPSPSHTRLSSSSIISSTKTASQATAPASEARRDSMKAFDTPGRPMKYSSDSACGLLRSSSWSCWYSANAFSHAASGFRTRSLIARASAPAARARIGTDTVTAAANAPVICTGQSSPKQRGERHH
jgi:hypothetical protein